MSDMRCPICCGELSYCGEPAEDGLPTIDCAYCQRGETIKRLSRQLANREEEVRLLQENRTHVFEIACVLKKQRDALLACRRGEQRYVDSDADDHCCRWTILVKEENHAAPD